MGLPTESGSGPARAGQWVERAPDTLPARVSLRLGMWQWSLQEVRTVMQLLQACPWCCTLQQRGYCRAEPPVLR